MLMREIKKKYFNLSFLGKAFLGFLFIASLIQVSIGTYRLASKSYKVSDADIYMVDSFRLQGKAFYNNRRKGSSPSYDFTSINGYSFVIDQKVYPGIIDKDEFADTFSYHNLKFIAYSTRKTAELYRISKEPIQIDLLQVQVGDKKYISVEGINAGYRYKVIRNILGWMLVFGFVLIRYLLTGKIFK
jgi:hypothetical protein